MLVNFRKNGCFEYLCKNFNGLGFTEVSIILTQIYYITDLPSECPKAIVIGLIVLRAIQNLNGL